MSIRTSGFLLFLNLLIGVISAQPSIAQRPNHPLYQLVSTDQSGITFANIITETETFNSADFIYAYNGGGVAVGDINGDGLPDLYFTSSQGSNRLFLNKGNLRFEDISEKAGVADSEGLSFGVTMADVE